MAVAAHFQNKSLRIHALTVCVAFDDYLAWTLPQNVRHFDSFTIITTQADTVTQQIANRYGAPIVLTDRLFGEGSQFDRGAAINDGLEQLQHRYEGDWFCIVDADMILPWNLREVLEKQPLDPRCIYGIDRGLPSDEPISGFFQLFHSSQRKRYQEGHHNAGYTDTWFRDLWPAEQQITWPDLKAEHLSRHGENWSGRVSERLDPPKQIITPDTPTERIRQLLCGPERHPLPRDWRCWPNVQEAYRSAMVRAVATMPPYPKNKYSGRGIVLIGGGKYFASVYVTLRMIRHVGCTLPAEVWYLGRNKEMDD